VPWSARWSKGRERHERSGTIYACAKGSASTLAEEEGEEEGLTGGAKVLLKAAANTLIPLMRF